MLEYAAAARQRRIRKSETISETLNKLLSEPFGVAHIVSPSFFFPLIRFGLESLHVLYRSGQNSSPPSRDFFPFVKRTYLRVRDMCVESLVRNTIHLVRCSSVFFLFSSCAAWLFFVFQLKRSWLLKREEEKLTTKVFFSFSEVSSSVE